MPALGFAPRVRIGLGVLACLIAASASAQTNTNPHQAVLRAQLASRLTQLADKVDGVMGYAVVDLTTGDRFGLRENEVYPTASTIKLSILYELFKQADAGTIKLDEPMPIPPASRVGGSGLLFELTSPRLSLRDYATLMILISDNTATNVIIDTLGLAKIQARLDGLGFTKTKLRRRMMDTDAARRGNENVSSPAEVARLLELFHKGEGLTAESKKAALDILTKPKTTAFTRTLPSGVRVASKPGGLDAVVVDAGLVLLDTRPYIAAFMCTYLLDEAVGNRAVGEASRAVFDYFERLGAEGSYGRRIR